MLRDTIKTVYNSTALIFFQVVLIWRLKEKNRNKQRLEDVIDVNIKQDTSKHKIKK